MKSGITGHQDLVPAEAAERVATAIDTIIERYGISEGFTCLARGADQLYAEILCRRGVPYTAVIPSQGYSSLFTSPVDRERFEELVRRASRTILLPFDRPSELAFYEAGKRMVDLSEALIAAWDGRSARGLGGTADVVSYALKHRRRVIQIEPTSGRMIEL